MIMHRSANLEFVGSPGNDRSYAVHVAKDKAFIGTLHISPVKGWVFSPRDTFCGQHTASEVRISHMMEIVEFVGGTK